MENFSFDRGLQLSTSWALNSSSAKLQNRLDWRYLNLHHTFKLVCNSDFDFVIQDQ